MKKQIKEFKIPFGAKDSELCGWEYTIPEGMEATIVDNKIVIKKKESEDERVRKELISFCNSCATGQTSILVKDSSQWKRWIDWLEKQGEQNLLDNVAKQVTKDKETATSFLKSTGVMDENGELAEPYRVCESTSNWSEEDDVRFTSTIEVLEFAHSLDSYNQYGKEDIRNNLSWLKSFKERYTWKPSSEQMYILNWVANILLNHDGIVEEEASKKLQSLYNDLKKLMEE